MPNYSVRVYTYATASHEDKVQCAVVHSIFASIRTMFARPLTAVVKQASECLAAKNVEHGHVPRSGNIVSKTYAATHRRKLVKQASECLAARNVEHGHVSRSGNMVFETSAFSIRKHLHSHSIRYTLSSPSTFRFPVGC